MQKTHHFTCISNEYQINRTHILGSGSTGEVYLGRQIQTGALVAVKLIRLSSIQNEVTKYLFKMQKLALSLLNHENVLRGLKIIQNSSKCYLITEYCNGGTLKQYIHKKGKLTQQQALNFFRGILKGYNNLVRRKIVHRDLKPANIMFHDNIPKIIDFGYCQVQGHEKPTLQYNVGSPSYMAPQSFHQNIYNEKSQIWSIGVILYECLMGKTFDEGKHMSIVYKELKKKGLPFTFEISQKCKNIIKSCLEMNPNKRPTALKLLDQLDQKKNFNNQPNFTILQRKKSISLFMDNKTGLNTKNSFSKNKHIKNINIEPVRHRRIVSGISCLDSKNQTQNIKLKSNYGQTDRVLFDQKIIINQNTKTIRQSVRNQYGLTSRDSCFENLSKHASQYIFSPKIGYTYASINPSKINFQKGQIQKKKNSEIKKSTQQKNPQSQGSNNQNANKKQVPFQEYFAQNKNYNNKNKQFSKKDEKQIYIPFDYKKFYSQKGKFQMTLKKENANRDLGQYIFSNYISPSYCQKQIKSGQRPAQFKSQKALQKKADFAPVSYNPSQITKLIRHQNNSNAQKSKPVSFFSKILSPFAQKTYR